MSSKNLMLKVGLIATNVDLEVGGPARDVTDGLRTVCAGVDGHSHAPIPTRMPTRCDVCGDLSTEQKWQLKKGRKAGDGYQLVDVEVRDEMKAAAIGATKTEIAMAPHPREQVDTGTVTGEKIYYLKPSSTAAGVNYAIIRSLVAAHPELAFTGIYTPSSRMGTFVLEVQGDVIVMRERTLVANARPRPAFEPVEPDANLDLAEMMLDRITSDFDPATYVDSYAANLAALLDEQSVVAAAASSDAPAAPAPTGADLTAQLLEFTKAKPAAKRPARKTAARKAAARKAPARKAS